MDQTRLLIMSALLVAVVIILAVMAYVNSRKRRRLQLRERFGPEYERVLKQEGDPHKAEGVLEFRQRRRRKLKVHPLSLADRSSFMVRWSEVQARFVDDPQGAVTVADSLITDIMQARGYPIGEFDQRVADLSVDHPLIVENYRTAHEIALRHGKGKAGTEDLRQAMVHYRLLFQELVDEQGRKKEA